MEKHPGLEIFFSDIMVGQQIPAFLILETDREDFVVAETKEAAWNWPG